MSDVDPEGQAPEDADPAGYDDVPNHAVTVAEHRRAARAHRDEGRHREARAHSSQALEMADQMQQDATLFRKLADTLRADGYEGDWLDARADRLEAEATAEADR